VGEENLHCAAFDLARRLKRLSHPSAVSAADSCRRRLLVLSVLPRRKRDEVFVEG
jgi:hypothetical protein